MHGATILNKDDVCLGIKDANGFIFPSRFKMEIKMGDVDFEMETKPVILTSPCLICTQNDHEKPISNFLVGGLIEGPDEKHKIFITICNSLEIRLNKKHSWDFKTEALPFCSSCTEISRELLEVLEQIRVLEIQVTGKVEEIRSLVIESSGSQHCSKSKGFEDSEKDDKSNYERFIWFRNQVVRVNAGLKKQWRGNRNKNRSIEKGAIPDSRPRKRKSGRILQRIRQVVQELPNSEASDEGSESGAELNCQDYKDAREYDNGDEFQYQYGHETDEDEDYYPVNNMSPFVEIKAEPDSDELEEADCEPWIPSCATSDAVPLNSSISTRTSLTKQNRAFVSTPKNDTPITTKRISRTRTTKSRSEGLHSSHHESDISGEGSTGGGDEEVSEYSQNDAGSGLDEDEAGSEYDDEGRKGSFWKWKVFKDGKIIYRGTEVISLASGLKCSKCDEFIEGGKKTNHKTRMKDHINLKHLNKFNKIVEIKTKTKGLLVFPSNLSGGNYTVGFNGFMYVYHNTGSKKRIFRCSKHQSDKCNARLHLSMDYKTVLCQDKAGINSHVDSPDPGKIDVKYGLWKMRSTAKSSQQSMASLLATTLESIPSVSQGSLPKLSSLQRTIRRYAHLPKKRRRIYFETPDEAQHIIGSEISQTEPQSINQSQSICDRADDDVEIDPHTQLWLDCLRENEKTKTETKDNTSVCSSDGLFELQTVTPGLKVFPSNRLGGNYTVAYKGYMYLYHTDGSNKKIFRCYKHRTGGCHARLHLSVDYRSVVCEDMALCKYHTDNPDPAKIDAKYSLWKMKASAKSSQQSPEAIVASELQRIPEASQASLPKLSSIKRTLRLVRAAKDGNICHKTASKDFESKISSSESQNDSSYEVQPHDICETVETEHLTDGDDFSKTDVDQSHTLYSIGGSENVTIDKLVEIQTLTEGLKVFPSNKSKGNYTAAFKGFMYMYHLTGSNKKIFRCCQHRKNCHARLHLSMDYRAVVSQDKAGENCHTDLPNPGKIDVKYSLWKMKASAKSSEQSAESLLATALQNIPEASQAALPKLSSMKHCIRHVRATKNRMENSADLISESLLPEIEPITPGLKVFPSTKTGGYYTVGFNGFMYVYHNTGSNKRIFRCTKYRSNCTARLHLSMDYRSVVCQEKAGENAHTHSPDHGKIDAKCEFWKMKYSSSSKSSEQTAESILANVLQKNQEESQAYLKLSSNKRNIHNARASNSNNIGGESECQDSSSNTSNALPCATSSKNNHPHQDLVQIQSDYSQYLCGSATDPQGHQLLHGIDGIVRNMTEPPSNFSYESHDNRNSYPLTHFLMGGDPNL